MNPSRLFILRPVATALTMVALLLAGGVAYRELPVSALPQVDYPTIQVTALYPGSRPRGDGLFRHGPARAAIGTDARPESNDLDQFRRQHHHHVAVQPGFGSGRRRTGSAGRNQCRLELPAARSAHSSHLQQGESGRCADPDLGIDVGDLAPVAGGRSRRDAVCAENFSIIGRGPRQHRRRETASSPHSG